MAVMAATTASLGQTVSTSVPSGPSYEQLIERLEAAERRLADLETSGANAPRATHAEGHDLTIPAGRVMVSLEPSSETNEDGSNDEGSNEEDDEKINEVSEQLEALQSDWDEFQETQSELKEAAKEKSTFQIGGRIHLDYWTFMDDSEGIHFFEHPDEEDPNFGTDPEDRFLFRRIRLEAEGTVPDLMFWRIQVDFNEPENPQMKDVYLGWELPYNQVMQVGHQKRPLGLDHLNSSRFNVFMERPLAVEAFNSDARRLGAQVLGYSDDLRFNWQYGVYGLEDIQRTGRFIGDSLQLGGYGRLASTPWYDETSGGRGYLHLALAGAVARPDGDVGDADSNTNEARFNTRPQSRTDSRWLDTRAIAGAEWFEHVGTEAVLNVGAVQFVGEYLATFVQRDGTTRGTGPNTFFHGGYVYASYFLTGEYMPWDRKTGTLDRIRPHENFFLIDRCTGGIGSGWGAWQLKARYDYLDLSDEDIRGGVENNLTFGLNWWWNQYARLQFDVTRGLIEQHRRVGGFDSGDFWFAGTRFNIDF